MADEELKKFEKLARDWWNVSGPMKMLHQLNIVRLEYITKNFSFENKKLLDFGCGGGILTESLYNKNNSIIGMDNNEKLLEIAFDFLIIAFKHILLPLKIVRHFVSPHPVLIGFKREFWGPKMFFL